MKLLPSHVVALGLTLATPTLAQIPSPSSAPAPVAGQRSSPVAGVP